MRGGNDYFTPKETGEIDYKIYQVRILSRARGHDSSLSSLGTGPTRKSGGEGKVRPFYRETLRHDRMRVKRGVLNRQGEFATIPSPPLDPCPLKREPYWRPSSVWHGRGRNLSGPEGVQNQNQTPGRDRAGPPVSFRHGAQGYKKRKRVREDHALSHSSARCVSDRGYSLIGVATQALPVSPFARHCRINLTEVRPRQETIKCGDGTCVFSSCLTNVVPPFG